MRNYLVCWADTDQSSGLPTDQSVLFVSALFVQVNIKNYCSILKMNTIRFGGRRVVIGAMENQYEMTERSCKTGGARGVYYEALGPKMVSGRVVGSRARPMEGGSEPGASGPGALVGKRPRIENDRLPYPRGRGKAFAGYQTRQRSPFR